MIAEFAELDPKKYLKSLYDDLDANGMLRSGDESNFRGIDSYLTERLAYLPDALERYRSGSICEYPYEDCNGECVPYGYCACVPPGEEPIPGGEGGAPSVGGGMGAPLPGGGGAGPIGAAGKAGVGGGIGAGGGGPIVCPSALNHVIAP